MVEAWLITHQSSHRLFLTVMHSSLKGGVKYVCLLTTYKFLEYMTHLLLTNFVVKNSLLRYFNNEVSTVLD